MVSVDSATDHLQLARIAVDIRNCTTLQHAAELMLYAGHILDLPAPSVVDDVRVDKPLELDGEILSRKVWDWNPNLLEWWYGQKVGLRHRDVQRATMQRLPYSSLVYDGEADQLTPEESDCRERMGRWGLRSMLLVPVHLPRGPVALVGSGSNKQGAVFRTSHEHWFTLVGVAHSFMDLVERKRGATDGSRKLLSLRQRECLAGMARGSSAKEVALALGLSPHTVREYLKDAAKRVNAKSRAQLISIALGSGELDDVILS